jgi:hypothetical protein
MAELFSVFSGAQISGLAAQTLQKRLRLIKYLIIIRGEPPKTLRLLRLGFSFPCACAVKKTSGKMEVRTNGFSI